MRPGPCVPEDRARVVSTGEHVTAIGRDRQAQDHFFVPFPASDLPRVQVPDPDGEIRPLLVLESSFTNDSTPR